MLVGNLKRCVPMSARISEAQCKLNRERGMMCCQHCFGLVPDLDVQEEKPVGEILSLRFYGEDANIVRKFILLAENGYSAEENVATMLKMVLDGKVTAV